ncbi:major facilitator superfamily MFS-1 [Heliocybe sulcata]|uniref:Major facilitator superfamily MFS-1 n=1 Tax=Heliocybe sulcata TaxID=5364 RepID=A0A5C3NL13_9AGAM|nr:major facilitator superfamily MFS-1 [Heliocybe sulcata]
MIVAISGSTLLNVYSGGAMTVAVPSIGQDLHFTQAALSWPLQAYNLTYGCLLLLTGRMADKYGRRPVFMVGTTWFTLLSIPPIFCPEPVSFIIVMGLSGLGASMMTSAGIGIIGGNLTGALKNRAMAVLAGGQSVGFILGILSSGFLCDLYRGWRYIFVLQAALGAIFLGAAWISVPKDRVKYDREMDWAGAGLSSLGLILLIFSLSWTTVYIPTLFCASILLLVLFVLWERRRESLGRAVLLPFSIFKQGNGRFGGVFAMVFLMWWSFNTVQYFVTLFYQDVQKLSPLDTGIRFIPESISGLIVNTLSGFIVEYIPGERLNAFGAGSLAASALFGVIDPDGVYWKNAFVVLILLPIADTAFIVGNIFTTSSMDEKSQALAGGLFSTATRISTAVGLALTSLVATSVSNNYARAHDIDPDSPRALLEGYHAAGWLCLAAATVGLMLNFWALRGVGVMGGSKGKQNAEREQLEMLRLGERK